LLLLLPLLLLPLLLLLLLLLQPKQLPAQALAPQPQGMPAQWSSSSTAR
jgi:hypothetical protein